MKTARWALLAGFLWAIVACEEELPPPPVVPPAPPTWQPSSSQESPPLGRLPDDVRPLHYGAVLTVDPGKDRFSGVVDIVVELLDARDVIWLHGKDLQPSRAFVAIEHEVAPVEARWEMVNDHGVAALRLPRPLGPGKATIHVEYDAAFNTRPEGLFVVSVAGKRYAFTDLEPSDARRIFPSFDEPSNKTPFDLTLVVPQGMAAIANAHEIGRVPGAPGTERVTFATTAPLPTYLFAAAVGPLDVVAVPPVPPNKVRARPLPLRGIATAGHGKDLAYALAHAGELLGGLEAYFGSEYPFDKLDLIAIPNLGGAMENAGAITFREWLLSVDPKSASVDQRRAFDSVATHELSHQWFGDLVTMKWWDDIWLNEAFATWMAARTVNLVVPGDRADVSLLASVFGAMGSDALASARSIRQPIDDQNDIANAFDDITYRKGGGVLAMFERWIGPETFQRGIQSYLAAHRFGSGTTEDLLAALSVAAKRDVVTPFKSFLDQPGVPFVEAKLSCGKGAGEPSLALKQSRYLPLGSKGNADELWQIPICVRYPVGKEIRETCTLLTQIEGALPLEGGACPAWVMPNADGAGYYRFALAAEGLGKLRVAGWPKLSTREKMSVANSVQAAFSRATTPAAAIFKELAPLATEPEPAVASVPMELVSTARDWLYADAAARSAVEGYGKKLYDGAYRDLGWAPKSGPKTEDPERGVLRQRVIGFLAATARDAEVRKEAAKRGRAYVGFGGDGAIHPDAVDPNLAGIALSVAVQESGADFFDALDKRLGETDDAALRGRLIDALASARTPELALRARNLALSPRLQANEITQPISGQLGQHETRDETWSWLVENIDALIARLPPGRAGGLPWMAARFCDGEHAKAAADLFGGRLEKLEGGPRNLAGTIEALELCQARRSAHEASLRSLFGGKAADAKAGVAPKAAEGKAAAAPKAADAKVAAPSQPAAPKP